MDQTLRFGMTDSWEKARLPIIKTLFNKLNNGSYKGPRFTLFELQDVALTKEGYEHEYTMYRHNYKVEPPTVPQAIFDYANRELIDLSFHYSDYHYNPYGDITASVVKLEGSYLKLIEMI